MALQMTGFVMLLPLFARRFDSFGAGVEALGVSAMAYALTSTFAAPFIGMLADRFGRRPIILLSLAAYVLAFSGYLFAASAWQLILLRGLAGAFTAGLLPAMTSIVGDLAPENRRAQWIGIVTGGASAGWIVGPLLGGLLYDRFGYVVPFAASITMAVGALLLAVFLIHETYTPAAHPSHPHSAWTHALQALPARPTSFLLMLITFGVMFAWAFIEPQFMFYAYDDLAWTSSRLGLVMSTYGLACMFGQFALGQLSDRLGRKPVLVLGLALFSAQFIGLVIFRDATWLVVSFILAGLGNGLFDPALSAHILDITPPEHTARIMGLKATAGSLGSMLGPALVVLFTPFVGPQVVFLVASALVIALTLVSAFALRVPQRSKVRPHVSNAAVTR
jgi:DHA1 family tetracycline resistance protein-like MFS transporter